MKRLAIVAVLPIWVGSACLWAEQPKALDRREDPGAVEAAATAKASEQAKEDPAHGELRALRDGLVAAIKKSDIDAVLTYLDPDVIVTWQNGEVSRKPDGVRAYYDRVMKGPNRVVESYTTSPTVDELTHLYGNSGVASGSSIDHYKLTDGSDFDLPTRWSATLVKDDGKWRIAAFHASVNMFDNPILWMTVKRAAIWTAAIAATVGVIVGLVVPRLFRRRPGPASRAAA